MDWAAQSATGAFIDTCNKPKDFALNAAKFGGYGGFGGVVAGKLAHLLRVLPRQLLRLLR